MSDIRSFFGGKATVTVSKPVAVEKVNTEAASNTSSAVVKDKENTASQQASTTGPCASITAPIITNFSLPTDVQKIITWKNGEPVPYLAIVETFDEISRVSGRIEKENAFARLFRAVIATTPADLDVIVYLASNEVYPVYEGREMGIGDSLLVKAVCEATGRKRDAVEESYEKEGDLVCTEIHSFCFLIR